VDPKIFDISGKRTWATGHRDMVDVSIREPAELMAKVVNYRGQLAGDASKPDAAPRRLLDSGRLAALRSCVSTELADGLGQMYRWCCNNKVNAAA